MVGIPSRLEDLLFPFPNEPVGSGKRKGPTGGHAVSETKKKSMVGGSRMVELLLDPYVNVVSLIWFRLKFL